MIYSAARVVRWSGGGVGPRRNQCVTACKSAGLMLGRPGG